MQLCASRFDPDIDAIDNAWHLRDPGHHIRRCLQTTRARESRFAAHQQNDSRLVANFAARSWR